MRSALITLVLFYNLICPTHYYITIHHNQQLNLTEKPDGRELLRHCLHRRAGEADPDGEEPDGGAEPGPVQGVFLHQPDVHEVTKHSQAPPLATPADNKEDQ